MIKAEDFFYFLNFSKLFQDILCLKCCLSCHKEHLQPTSTRFLVFTETRPNSWREISHSAASFIFELRSSGGSCIASSRSCSVDIQIRLWRHFLCFSLSFPLFLVLSHPSTRFQYIVYYKIRTKPLLQLLLRSQLVGVSTLSLTTVGGSWWQSSVTFTTDRLFTVVFGSQSLQRWFNHD